MRDTEQKPTDAEIAAAARAYVTALVMFNTSRTDDADFQERSEDLTRTHRALCEIVWEAA